MKRSSAITGFAFWLSVIAVKGKPRVRRARIRCFSRTAHRWMVGSPRTCEIQMRRLPEKKTLRLQEKDLTNCRLRKVRISSQI